MAAIVRLLIVLLAVVAGAALAGGGILLINSIVGFGSTGGINFSVLTGPLSALPIALAVIWLFAWSRLVFGPVRHPVSAAVALLLFLLGLIGVIYAVVADMPFGVG